MPDLEHKAEKHMCQQKAQCLLHYNRYTVETVQDRLALINLSKAIMLKAGKDLSNGI
jgi:hypothetical protein